VVLGKSGSGKSITIKCVVGLVGADSGVINVLALILPKLIPTNSMKYEFELVFFSKRSIIRFHERTRKNLRFTIRQKTVENHKGNLNVK
jgi:phospholipid/cholesterol/gamma-HCH transport system ATP-binding protein